MSTLWIAEARLDWLVNTHVQACGKRDAKSSLSAIDFGQRSSPPKTGISRTAGFLRWSTVMAKTCHCREGRATKN